MYKKTVLALVVGILFLGAGVFSVERAEAQAVQMTEAQRHVLIQQIKAQIIQLYIQLIAVLKSQGGNVVVTPTVPAVPTTPSTPTIPTGSFSCANQPSTTIFCDDFESGTLSKWDQVAANRYRVTSDSDEVYSGSRALEGVISSTLDTGELNKWFSPGYDELWVRMNVKFDEDFRNMRGDGNGMHFFRVAGNREDNKWSAHGQAGKRPTGTDFFSIALDPEYVHRDPTLRPLMFYTYWPDMSCSGGCWGNSITQNSPKTPLNPGQWYEVVIHIKLNTIGQSDGFQELYINGERRIQKTGMRYRTTTNLRLNEILFSNYMEDTTQPEQYIWVDNVAVSTTAFK